MGAIHNNSGWVRGFLFSFSALLLLLAPGAALAEDASPSALDPIEAQGNPSPSLDPARASGPVDATLPLTRAAARERVAAMSPAAWLASYGDVVVGRTGTSLADER